MPREITGARDCLNRLNQYFPNKELLTKRDIHIFFGISYNTLRKYYPELWVSRFTLKTDLAKIMAKKSINKVA